MSSCSYFWKHYYCEEMQIGNFKRTIVTIQKWLKFDIFVQWWWTPTIWLDTSWSIWVSSIFFMIFPISVNIEMLRTDFYLLKSKLMQRILKWMVFFSPLKIIVRLSKMLFFAARNVELSFFSAYIFCHCCQIAARLSQSWEDKYYMSVSVSATLWHSTTPCLYR